MGLDRPIDITTEQRKTLLTLLERHLPDTTAWVYGSRVKWTARPESDLDMVVFTTAAQERRVSDLKDAFEESSLPFRVDLFVWDEIPKQFHERIEAEHVVLVDNETVRENFDWRQTTLGKLLKFSNGKTSPERSNNFSCPVYGSNGIIGFTDKTNSPPMTTVIGRVGSYCGSLYYSEDVCWVTDNAIKANAIDENDSKFLFYLLQTLRLNDWRSGSGQPLLNQTILSSIPVTVPSPSEQSAIAHILGTLDDKIELNRRMNETLEAMARALFKSWFVDFDPVRAKMEGRDTGLPQRIADLFPDRLVESELGEIPEGWEISTIGEEVTVVGGSTPSTKDRGLWDGEINWATPKDLSTLSAPVLLETARLISDAGLSKISSGLLPQGVVLLSSRAPIGYLAIAEIPVAVNQGFIAMKCESRLSNMFVWLWTQANMDIILQNSNGSTFQEISKRNFRPLNITIPEPEILSVFDKHVRLLYKQIVKNQRESRTLAVLRDALLPKLVSGEIRLRNAEAIVVEVS